jgi:hypothetical protein
VHDNTLGNFISLNSGKVATNIMNFQSFSAQTRRWQLCLAVCIMLSFSLKLWISLSTVGTDDAARWYAFASHIRAEGGLSLYRHIDMFNHPPFMVHLLQVIDLLSSWSGLSFYFWLRLPAILADLVSVWAIWRLLYSRLRPLFSPVAMVLLALAPASVMISGFHGNTDPLMICLLLLTLYWLDDTRAVWLAGIAFGMSMSIKVVPIIFLPALVLHLPNHQKRLIFLASVVLTFVVAGLPYTLQEPLFIANRVFGYNSIYGQWGIPRILTLLGKDSSIAAWLSTLYATFGRWLVLSIIVAESLWMNRSRHRPQLFMQCSLIMATFMSMTPGFGVQYLTWLVPWVVINYRTAFFYYTVSGSFLFAVYTAWSDGLPWFYAVSFLLDGPLVYIELLCWFSIIVFFLQVHILNIRTMNTTDRNEDSNAISMALTP